MARNARNLKAIVTKYSLKERYKTAQTYLQKLKSLMEDVSMLSGIYKILLNIIFSLWYKSFSLGEGVECF